MVNPSVMLSFPHPGSVRTEFMMSVLAAMGGDSPVAQIDAYGTGPTLSKARNEMARRFLATSCEWLWMADADMEFTARTLPALLSAADPASAPVIGALCFAKDPGGGIFPVAYKSALDESGNLLFGRAKLVWHPDGKPVRVAATGTGCLLMHRSVFARIDESCPQDRGLWFAEARLNPAAVDPRDKHCGEDISFCYRCGRAGIPVMVHSGVRAGHVKTVPLGGQPWP